MNLAPVQEHCYHHQLMKPLEQGLAGVSPVQQILHDLVVGPFRAEVGQDPRDPQGPTPQDALEERGHVGDRRRLEAGVDTVAQLPQEEVQPRLYARRFVDVREGCRQVRQPVEAGQHVCDRRLVTVVLERVVREAEDDLELVLRLEVRHVAAE